MQPLLPEVCYNHDPAFEYVSEDPEKCEAMFFVCANNEKPFFDDCGCGCMKTGD
jgi:hypothetical protein